MGKQWSFSLLKSSFKFYSQVAIQNRTFSFQSSCDSRYITVVPAMNGHPRDQAKVSVHDRWPLIRGTGGQVKDATFNTPRLSPPAIFILNTSIVIIMYAIVIKPKTDVHNITAEILFRMRILVFSQRNSSFGASRTVFNINPVARIPLAQDGSLVCFESFDT